MSEITEADLSWQDPYCLLQGHTGAKAAIACFQFGCLILGSFLSIGIIAFERHGQDPKKRGVLNQIISQMIGIVLIFEIITTPLNVWRMVVSPITGVLYWIWWFLASHVCINHGLLAIEYAIIKYLIIVVYKQFLPIVDDFFADFFMVANFGIASWISLVNLYTTAGLHLEKRVAGMPLFLVNNSKYEPMIILALAIVTVSTTSIVHVLIWWHKRNQVEPEDSVLTTNNNDNNNNNVGTDEANLNNIQYNRETINIGLLLISLCLAGSAVMAGMHGMSPSSGQDDEQPSLTIYLLSDLSHLLVMTVIIPSFMYGYNSDLRKYVMKVIKETLCIFLFVM